MVETRLRSVIKAISWRAGGTIVTCIVAWLVTDNFDIATRIGILDTVIKVGVFYAHERFWNRVNFGKRKPPEYNI